MNKEDPCHGDVSAKVGPLGKSGESGAGHGSGNTLRPIEIRFEELRGLPFQDLLDRIHADLEEVKTERFDFYYTRVRANSRWALGLKNWLSVMAAVALVLTALAALLRLYAGVGPADPGGGAPAAGVAPVDIWLFAAALVIYALMAALALYEKGTDRTSAYFRHLATLLAIRDLWTKLLFELLPESRRSYAAGSDEEQAAVERVIALAAAFVGDLDRLATDELGTWRTEHTTSLNELEQIAETGRTGTSASLQAALSEQRKARAAREAAGAEAIVNFTVAPAFEGEVTVTVDGREAEKTHLRSFVVDGLSPGLVTIRAQAKGEDGKARAASFVRELRPGVQDIEIELA